MPSFAYTRVIDVPAVQTGTIVITIEDSSVIGPAPYVVSLFPQMQGLASPEGRFAQTVDFQVTGVSGQSLTGHVTTPNPPLIEPGYICEASTLLNGILNGHARVDGIFYPMTAVGINAALDDIGAAGGGTVELAPAIMIINATVRNHWSNTYLEGQGGGWDGNASADPPWYSTVLRWLGASDGATYMLDLGPLDGATIGIEGSGVRGFLLDGNNLSVRPLRVRSARNGPAWVNSQSHAGTYAVYIDASPDINPASDYAAVQFMDFRGAHKLGAAAVSGGYKVLKSGITSYCTFEGLVDHAGPLHGFDWWDADGHVFSRLAIARSEKTATITLATPGVVTCTAHGYVAGDKVVFSTTGTLPTGIVAGRTYYVIAAGLTANAFEFSATSGGAAINTSVSQSGVHGIGGCGFNMHGVLYSNNNRFDGVTFGKGNYHQDAGAGPLYNILLNTDYYNGGAAVLDIVAPASVVKQAQPDKFQAEKHGVTQAVPTGVATKITFPTAVYNLGYNVTSGLPPYDTSTSLFTAGYAGYFRIDAQVDVLVNNDSVNSAYGLQVFINGSLAYYGGIHTVQATGSSATAVLGFHETLHLNAQDTVGIYLLHDAGGDRTVNAAAAAFKTRFSASNIERD